MQKQTASLVNTPYVGKTLLGQREAFVADPLQAWLPVTFLGLAVLGGVVLWLTIQIIRLRVEALINRRVIASLQKSRAMEPRENPTTQVGEIVRLLLLGIVALASLLLLFQVLTR